MLLQHYSGPSAVQQTFLLTHMVGKLDPVKVCPGDFSQSWFQAGPHLNDVRSEEALQVRRNDVHRRVVSKKFQVPFFPSALTL